MKRRNYLKFLGIGPLFATWPVLALPVHERQSGTAGLSEAMMRRCLSVLVQDPPRASMVGRAYLRAYPDRREWTMLLADSGLARFREGMLRDVPSMRRDLDGLRSQDFHYGNTVILDGWILARSEVSLCALVAIGIGIENAA